MTTSVFSRIACTLCLFACAGGSETGNPAQSTLVGVCAWSSDTELVSLEPTAADVVMDDVWIAFGAVDLRADVECNEAVGDDTGPTVLATELTGSRVEIPVHASEQDYCGVVVPLKNMTDGLPARAPSDLGDHSVVIRGHRADGVPFTLRYPEPDELELVGDFTVPSDEGPLLLVFDVAGLMRNVALDAATLESDGTILIDDVRNRALLLAFETNLECALELHRDTNADGRRDDGDVPLARCIGL